MQYPRLLFSLPMYNKSFKVCSCKTLQLRGVDAKHRLTLHKDFKQDILSPIPNSNDTALCPSYRSIALQSTAAEL